MEELPDEEDIDLETLQAQIDLSLAHTKNLVSSWLQPTYAADPSQSRHVKDEKEIEEILRRPPRLGVGAPIPASTGSTGHETMKLKSKLSGKKRQREDDVVMATADQSEDEAESRAGAIKKKVKSDPFTTKKKKKLASSALSKASSTLRSSSPEQARMKREKRGSTLMVLSSRETGISDFLIQPPLRSSQHIDLTSPTPPASPTRSFTSAPSGATLQRAFTPPPNSNSINPVLNLDGPPIPPNSPSAKKKRKKRRKKKKVAEQAASASIPD